ncbi:MAG: hypothetical protein AAF471_06110 [Myxococcota bacterium]
MNDRKIGCIPRFFINAPFVFRVVTNNNSRGRLPISPALENTDPSFTILDPHFVIPTPVRSQGSGSSGNPQHSATRGDPSRYTVE